MLAFLLAVGMTGSGFGLDIDCLIGGASAFDAGALFCGIKKLILTHVHVT